MALFLTESDVLELLPMERAIERIESSFVAQHKGEAINRSRERIFLPHSSLHYMAGALSAENLLGTKHGAAIRAGTRPRGSVSPSSPPRPQKRPSPRLTS